MTPDEIASWIADRKCRALNDPDTDGCPVPDQCECETLDAIAAAIAAERKALDFADAQFIKLNHEMAKLRADKEKAEAEIATWIERHDLKRDELFKAEAERDEADKAAITSSRLMLAAILKTHAIRNAALREAAAVCDNYRHPDGSSSGLAQSLADAILALIKETHSDAVRKS